MSHLETVAPGIRRLALRTPTLPPATHTNCYVVGEDALWVVDPASPWDDEQAALAAALDAEDAPVAGLFLTHHHHDHVAGAEALRDHLGGAVPIAAHEATARLVADEIRVDRHVRDGETLDLGGVVVHAVHTPGHAPGHLVLHEPVSGAIVAGDMVAGVGTILLHPEEGDLGDYLASLERMRALSPSVLLPSHGPALEQADAVLGFYVAHRHERSQQIRDALRTHGALSADELPVHVYPELPPEAHPIAALQIETHLRWLDQHGMVRSREDGRWMAR